MAKRSPSNWTSLGMAVAVCSAPFLHLSLLTLTIVFAGAVAYPFALWKQTRA